MKAYMQLYIGIKNVHSTWQRFMCCLFGDPVTHSMTSLTGQFSHRQAI